MMRLKLPSPKSLLPHWDSLSSSWSPQGVFGKSTDRSSNTQEHKADREIVGNDEMMGTAVLAQQTFSTCLI